MERYCATCLHGELPEDSAICSPCIGTWCQPNVKPNWQPVPIDIFGYIRGNLLKGV